MLYVAAAPVNYLAKPVEQFRVKFAVLASGQIADVTTITGAAVWFRQVPPTPMRKDGNARSKANLARSVRSPK